MQLPLFTNSIKFGNIIIHNFTDCDLMRLKGCGIEYEYVNTIGDKRQWTINN